MTTHTIHPFSKDSLGLIPQSLTEMNIKKVVIGLAILSSIVITIVLICRCIFKDNHSHPSPDIDKMVDLVKVDPAPAKVDPAPAKVDPTKDKSRYGPSTVLAKEGKFQLAWESYCQATYFDVHGHPFDQQSCPPLTQWIELPAEEVISGYMNTLSNSEIDQQLPVELIRDCLLTYPALLKAEFFTFAMVYSDRHPQYIIDICKAHPEYGIHIVLDGIDNYISPYNLTQERVRELYWVIYPSLLQRMQNVSLAKGEKDSLDYFLGLLQNPSDKEMAQMNAIKKLLARGSHSSPDIAKTVDPIKL